MPTLNNQPPPPSPVPGSNGVGNETQPDQDDETETTYDHGGYVLNDFSQQKINSGQQKINGLIRDADREVVKAFNEVRNLIAVLAAHGHVDLQALDAAIAKVAQATAAIAGPFPPGCGSGTQSPPPGE
jgi:hypothetical protein